MPIPSKTWSKLVQYSGFFTRKHIPEVSQKGVFWPFFGPFANFRKNLKKITKTISRLQNKWCCVTQTISWNQGILGCNGFLPPIIMAILFFNVQWLLHHVETHHPWECLFLRRCLLLFVCLRNFANLLAMVEYIGKPTLCELEVSQVAYCLAWAPWLQTNLLTRV